jgi:cell division topological specificity factor
MRKLFDLFTQRRSAPIARERLQILLEYERSLVDQTDLIVVLREEILRLVARYVKIDSDTVNIRVDRGNNASLLAVGIRIRNAG